MQKKSPENFYQARQEAAEAAAKAAGTAPDAVAESAAAARAMPDMRPPRRADMSPHKPVAIDALQFNADGLLPVVTQCASSGAVLMVAWMNRAALEKTLNDNMMTYYSRSRKTLWTKGETSGNVQRLLSLHTDCDGDTLLAKVEQTGAACHTNRPSCFYAAVARGNSSPPLPPFTVLPGK